MFSACLNKKKGPAYWSRSPFYKKSKLNAQRRLRCGGPVIIVEKVAVKCCALHDERTLMYKNWHVKHNYEHYL